MKTIEWQARIQQLVDGEVEHGERSRLLRSIPDHSPLWRELALAFVERQVFDESLGAPTANRRDENSGLDSGLKILLSIADSHPNGAVRPISRHSAKRTSAMFWTAIAGCLALGLILGEVHGRRIGGIPIPNENLATAELGERGEPIEAARAGEGIPLADALSRASHPIPVDFRRALMKQGYLITELDRPSKVRLPSGQLVEIPLRQVAVTYLGNATYQ
jgi:hypothetical protein